MLPILTPCFEKNSCKEDRDLRVQRIAITAIVTLALSMLLLIPGEFFSRISADVQVSFILVISITFFIGTLYWDIRKTNQAACSKRVADSKVVEEPVNLKTPSETATSVIQNNLTVIEEMSKTADYKFVKQYMRSKKPSRAARSHIRHNLTALQLLIALGGDVNKKDKRGKRLLDDTTDLEIYNLLTKHADMKLRDGDGVSYFEIAIKSKNPQYLRCIFENNENNPTRIRPDHFIKKQMKFWKIARTAEAIDLLHQFGFNVNMQDRDGCTPLLRLIRRIALRKVKRETFTRSERVRALLNCGADSAIPGMVKEKGKKEKQERRATDIKVPAKISDMLAAAPAFHPHYHLKTAKLPC